MKPAKCDRMDMIDLIFVITHYSTPAADLSFIRFPIQDLGRSGTALRLRATGAHVLAQNQIVPLSILNNPLLRSGQRSFSVSGFP
ncbi:MAG: hypothetical protein RL519_445 [Pseudomonadota bacterium]